MHPQLSDRKIICKDFIQALEQCHSSFVARMSGYCNRQADELNACLRKERLARTADNREQAKVRRAKREQSMKEFYNDEI
ncbi:hypothetical protein EDD85DRAFT_486229 [Armillaria nabsnona]|nr:hypothetical protein EDD85DRAFT_486229 [Armillaria nabsnona]